MSAERIRVLEYELRAVRALRSAPDKSLVREALTREEELEQQIEQLRGHDSQLQLIAAEPPPSYHNTCGRG